MSNGIFKGMFLAFVILYIISPIDALPGPIDDLLLALMASAVNRKDYID